ncbi:MAG: hypothetical protein WCT08_02030 [Patescibacteria group bacterium]|jgi:hypothetical protein
MARIEPVKAQSSVPNKSGINLPVPKFTIGRLIKLIILVLVVWTAIQVARTGLWQIPLFTKYFYQAPEPIRIVGPISQNFPELIIQSKADITNKNFRLSEGGLTYLLANSIAGMHLGISRPNLTIESQTMEFSFLIPKKNNAIVRLYLQPILNAENSLEFVVSKTFLGQVSVPSWLIGEPTKILLAQELSPILKVAPEIRQVKLESRNLILGF